MNLHIHLVSFYFDFALLILMSLDKDHNGYDDILSALTKDRYVTRGRIHAFDNFLLVLEQSVVVFWQIFMPAICGAVFVSFRV